MMDIPKAFISSTCDAMREYREAAKDACLRAWFFPVTMEMWSAKDSLSEEVCKERVGQSDLFVLLLGSEYGSLIPGREPPISYTEYEYDCALAAGKSILAFALSSSARSQSEPDEGDTTSLLAAFTARVSPYLQGRFSTRSELELALYQSVYEWRATWTPGLSMTRGSGGCHPELLQALRCARDALAHGREALEGVSGCLIDTPEKVRWLARAFSEAREEVLVVCYSLVGWKDQIEQDLLGFVREGGRLRVLMLDPRSTGFVEKSALEAAGYQELLNQRGAPEDLTVRWGESAAEVRETHLADIEASVKQLAAWARTAERGSIEYRLYGDTPLIYGFLFDSMRLYFSSYFLDPMERAHKLPAVCIEDATSDPVAAALRRVFLQWFAVKFANGRVLPTSR